MLHSQMAGTADNNGAFDFVISKMGNRISQQPFMREKEATNGYASNSPEMILSTTSA
jgi:hypothetical protein